MQRAEEERATHAQAACIQLSAAGSLTVCSFVSFAQSELQLDTAAPVGRRLSEAVALNLGAEYVSELGSGGAWDDQRLTKSEIAADPEAAALVAYFRQVRGRTELAILKRHLGPCVSGWLADGCRWAGPMLCSSWLATARVLGVRAALCHESLRVSLVAVHVFFRRPHPSSWAWRRPTCRS